MDRVVLKIEAADAGHRLDRLLSERLQTPRNQIQRWIREGHVLVDGRTVKASHVTETGETIDCAPQITEAAADLRPSPGALEVVHQDEAIAVLDKPAGLVVHPGAGNESDTLVHRLLARFPETANVGGRGRPGIVHRLDKDTSGILVIARTGGAYQRLSEAFAERRVEKTYLAVAYGRLRQRSGQFDDPIGRHPTRRKEMAAIAHGRPALTRYRSIASEAGISLLELDLATGRTHQIRVHLKSAGHPLIGDPVYGEARWKSLPRHLQARLREFPRPALHAWRLRLTHPTTGSRMTFEAPVPADILALWRDVTNGPFPSL